MRYLCYDTALNGEYTLIQLLKLYPNNRSLFAGTDDEKIWDAAPWLFELKNNVFDLSKDALIKLDHVIIFESNEDVKNVCDYLQTKMYIKDGGRDYYFRIWDARVLLKSLPNWRVDEIHDFFTVFDAFYTHNENDFLDKWQWIGNNRLESTKVENAVALPIIKTEEELDREYDAWQQPIVNIQDVPSAETAEVKPPEPIEEDKPKRRKFFLD